MLWESPFYPSQCQQFVTFCKEMYETLTRPRYNLGQKVLRILLFLTHRRPTLRIWNHGDPSPTPPWSMLFSRQQKCSGHTSTLLFWGEGGISWVNRALEGSILKLHIQRAFFLTFLSKILFSGYWTVCAKVNIWSEKKVFFQGKRIKINFFLNAKMNVDFYLARSQGCKCSGAGWAYKTVITVTTRRSCHGHRIIMFIAL